MSDIVIFFCFIFLMVYAFSEDTPNDKRLKCIKYGISHQMPLDDIERLCGKAPEEQKK